MLSIFSQIKGLAENNNDLSLPRVARIAIEALLEASKDKDWVQSLPGLKRTNSGIQHPTQGPSQGSPGPAGGGFEAAKNPNPTEVLNVEDSSAVSIGEDVDFFDGERLI